MATLFSYFSKAASTNKENDEKGVAAPAAKRPKRDADNEPIEEPDVKACGDTDAIEAADKVAPPVPEEAAPTLPTLPIPPPCWDLWDARHLRLPCSTHCHNKWNIITNVLAEPITDAPTLLERIAGLSSTPTTVSQLGGLRACLEAFSDEETALLFSKILPGIVKAVLNLPMELESHGKPVPLLLGSTEVQKKRKEKKDLTIMYYILNSHVS